MRHWPEVGLCADNPTPFEEVIDYLFEPTYRLPPMSERYPFFDEAVALCEQCPLKDLCREAGANETTGIWGGRIANAR